MEYLILFSALLLCGLFLFFLEWQRARKYRKRQQEKIADSFGKCSERIYEEGEFFSISRYFERHQEGFFVDDITANDLELDEIFKQMNITCSSAGQEYLYYMLRTPSFSEEELSHREELMDYFISHKKERVQLQMLYYDMGRTRKYSIYDYLDFLDELDMGKNWIRIARLMLFIPAFLLTAAVPQLGLLALFGLMGCQGIIYLREKKVIEPFLVSFQYVFRTLSLAEKLINLKLPVLTEENRQLKELLGRFAALKRRRLLGMYSMSTGSNPIDLVFAYVNMVLHLDILAFSSMLKQVRMHQADIDGLLTQVGRIEALLAAASYRQSLPAGCIPQLSAGDRVRLDIRGLYHPLLKNPVKNDIRAAGGVLLTGSNASGKSTFLKAVAINAILAQTIHCCAADSYSGCFYRTLTSMALRDDLSSQESYYIVEIRSLKRILDLADTKGAPVLCFVDEVLRGTNTVERIAASTQILKSLHRENVCCFAATHDVELTDLLSQIYDNHHFEEQIEDGDIFFPYKLMPGKATTRNAIRLLAVMGYNDRIIEEAEALAAHFMEAGSWL